MKFKVNPHIHSNPVCESTELKQPKYVNVQILVDYTAVFF